MKKSSKLFTSGGDAIPQREIYLNAITGQIKSYKLFEHSGSIGQTVSITNLAIRYLKFEGSYLKKLQACLNKFDGKPDNFFFRGENNDLLGLYREKSKKIKQDLLEDIAEKTKNKEREPILSIESIYEGKENEHAHKYIKQILNNIYDDYGEIIIFKLPEDTLNHVERKLRKIAVKDRLIFKAFDHAKKSILISGQKKYKARKLVNGINSIYQEMIINNSTNEPKKKYLNQKLSKTVNEAVNKYEVIDKPHYLLSKSDYKKAVRGNFQSKLKNK